MIQGIMAVTFGFYVALGVYEIVHPTDNAGWIFYIVFAGFMSLVTGMAMWEWCDKDEEPEPEEESEPPEVKLRPVEIQPSKKYSEEHPLCVVEYTKRPDEW